MQLEVERQALQKEKDKASHERLQKIEETLANLKERSVELMTRWQTEKDAITELREIKERGEAVKLEMETAERQADLEKAARIRYGELPALQQRRVDAEARLQQLQKEGALLKEEVMPKKLRILFPAGLPSRFPIYWKAKWKNCCTWKNACICV